MSMLRRLVPRLRPARCRPSGEDGLSVIEVIVAMTIIGGVMASASLFFLNGLKGTSGQSQRQTAVTLANQALEAAQSLAPSALLAGRSCSAVYALTSSVAGQAISTQDQVASSSATQTLAGNCDTSGATGVAPIPVVAPPTTVNGVAYTISTYVDVCWLTGSATNGTCTATTGVGLTKMFRVSVDVSYAEAANLSCSGYATGQCDFVASTLIDPTSDPTFNSNISTPKVTVVSPASVVVGSTTSVTLAGSGFVNGIAISVPSAAGVVKAISSNTGTNVVFTLAAGSAAGTYTITLLNPDGGTTTTTIVENAVPTITSVSPTSVTAGSTTTLTLNGTGFQSGAAITVDVGGTTASGTVVSSTKATVSFTSSGAVGTSTLTLTNPDGGAASGTFAVTNPTAITSITPTSVACAGGATTLTVNGTGFKSGATVSDGGADAFGAATVSSSTKVTVTMTPSSTTSGARAITLTNTDGTSASYGFTVTGCAPTIATFSPTTFTRSSSTTFTITGTGFVNGATVSIVSGGYTAYNGTATYVNSTTLKFSWNTSVYAAGTYNPVTVVVTNPDGTYATANVKLVLN